MRKTVYRLKKFRLTEISLVDRPACDIATVERIELAKRASSVESVSNHDRARPLESVTGHSSTEENGVMTTREINNLPDSDFAYVEPGGSRDAEGKTTPRSLRHFPIHDAAHVRDALARLHQSKFGEAARPAILAAAAKFGINVRDGEQREGDGRPNPTKEKQLVGSAIAANAKAGAEVTPGISATKDSGAVSPDAGFRGEVSTPGHRPAESIAGDPLLAGEPQLQGQAHLLESANHFALTPGELKKYVPLQAVPISDPDYFPISAVSLAEAIAAHSFEGPVPELCDLLSQVLDNILGSSGLPDKQAAILKAADDFKTAISTLGCEETLNSRDTARELRRQMMRVERAVRVTTRKQELAEALKALEFTWPAGSVAIRVLGDNDRLLGSLTQAEFNKVGATLSEATRRSVHAARNVLIGMCSRAGCREDAKLKSYLEDLARDPENEAASPSETRQVPNGAAQSQLDKILENLRQAASTLSLAADEVRKVAEASVGSIRKAEGSAKVLSALAERVSRLEAQPDNSAPQPLRTVEKGTPLNFGAEPDDTQLKIATLQREAAELRKHVGDPATQKRLSDIGVEIIRLSNGVDSAAAVFRAATGR